MTRFAILPTCEVPPLLRGWRFVVSRLDSDIVDWSNQRQVDYWRSFYENQN